MTRIWQSDAMSLLFFEPKNLISGIHRRPSGKDSWAFAVEGVGSNPGWETKIPQTTWNSQKIFYIDI